MSGLLIIPGNPNQETIKNILWVLNKELNQKFKKILFLETIRRGNINSNQKFEVYRGYIETVLTTLGEEYEIRIKNIDDIQMEIPQIIANAVKENGKDNVFIDLTNGKKDLTGSLYAAASICGIEHMYYIEVHRDKNGNFYKLYELEDATNDYYSVIRFKPTTEIQSLAGINYIDFVSYKHTIDEIFDGLEHISSSNIIKSALEKALIDYFDGLKNKVKYRDNIRNVGWVNEYIVPRLVNVIRKKCEGEDFTFLEHKDKPYKFLHLAFDSLRNDTNPAKSKNHTGKLNFLLPLVGGDSLITYIRHMRNSASHANDASIQIRRMDAKLCLDAIITLLKTFKDNGILEEILNQDDSYEIQ